MPTLLMVLEGVVRITKHAAGLPWAQVMLFCPADRNISK